jgi:hypothetical protein
MFSYLSMLAIGFGLVDALQFLVGAFKCRWNFGCIGDCFMIGCLMLGFHTGIEALSEGWHAKILDNWAGQQFGQ